MKLRQHKHTPHRYAYSGARLDLLFDYEYVMVRRDECRCGAQRVSFFVDGQPGGRATGRWTRPEAAPRS
jgi:hypothetical protein